MRVVGIVGAGTMGCGIAQGAAVHGFLVRLHDSDPLAAVRGLGRVRDALARAVDKGRMSADDAADAAGRVAVSDLAGLAACDLVIEAIFEDAAAKSALFAALSGVVAPDAILATNTSSLRVGDLAAAAAAPERFLGLHYFFPAAVNPLVEVVRGPRTGDAAMVRAFAFAEACGKRPIACADAFGFAVNRFFVPYLNEAARMADEGVDPGAVDAVAREAFGTAAGPFRVMDMTKPAIALHAARTLQVLGPFYAPAPGLVRVAESGANWNPADALVPADAEAIRDRLYAAVLLAVLQERQEGVATADDIDLGARLGLQWRWQPCAAMRTMGRDAVEALVAPLAARHGTTMPAV